MNRMWRTWPLAACVLAVPVLLIGLKVRGDDDNKPPAKKDDNKAPAKKEKAAPKKDGKQQEEAPNFFPNFDELMKPFAQGPNDDQFKEIRKRMEEMRKRMEKTMEEMRKRHGIGGGGLPMMPQLPRLPMLPGFPGERADRPRASQQPRLGAQVSKPSKTLEDQLDLPKDQGLVLEEIAPNSAAAKAGLKAHDILLELNGKPVPSKVEDFAGLLKEVKPGTPVNVVVLRKGKKETIKGLSLPEVKAEAPAAPAAPRVPRFPGRLGGRNFLPNIGNLAGSTSYSRVNDDFTATNTTDGVKITVKGKIDQGKSKVSEVTIDSDGKTKTYDSVDKVPAEHKETVQKLAGMGTKGGTGLKKPQQPEEEVY
jgi:membrane-associated protease RseP (regulator of RpoE activity)